MQDPTNQSEQPVPIKLVLPRWLVRGLIVFFTFCFVSLAALFVYSMHLSKKAETIFPKSEQERHKQLQDEEMRKAREAMEKSLYATPNPTPAAARKDQ